MFLTYIDLILKLQFTLYCELKGNKPDYRHAMSGESAQQFYEDFITYLRQQYKGDMVQGKRVTVYWLCSVEGCYITDDLCFLELWSEEILLDLIIFRPLIVDSGMYECHVLKVQFISFESCSVCALFWNLHAKKSRKEE